MRRRLLGQGHDQLRSLASYPNGASRQSASPSSPDKTGTPVDFPYRMAQNSAGIRAWQRDDRDASALEPLSAWIFRPAPYEAFAITGG